MRAIILALALLAPSLRAQGPAPRFMYIYRDSLKRGAGPCARSDGARSASARMITRMCLESLAGEV